MYDCITELQYELRVEILWHVIAELITLVGIRAVQFIEVGEDSVLYAENIIWGKPWLNTEMAHFLVELPRLVWQGTIIKREKYSGDEVKKKMLKTFE